MKLMYFQFSSHLLLFAWRLPTQTGKKDFFPRHCNDGDNVVGKTDKDDKTIVRRLSPQTRERKFEQNMGKQKYFKPKL